MTTTATELLQHYESGELSPVSVIEEYLNRIDEHNSGINAFCSVFIETALAQPA